MKRSGSPLLRLALDLRSARIAEAQQLRGLVEGFADRIVERRAEPHVFSDIEHGENLRMPAGGEEQAVGKRRAVGQPRGERVGFEMIDGDQRLLGDQRDRLGGGQPDDDAADQARARPRPRRRRDRRKLTFAAIIALAMAMIEHLDMRARGDFRHHAAIGRVLGGLRQHDVGEDFAAPVLAAPHHRGRGLVAGRLDAENEHSLVLGASARNPRKPDDVELLGREDCYVGVAL